MSTKRSLIVGGSLIAIALGFVAFVAAFPAFFFYHYDPAEFVQIQTIESPDHVYTAVLAERIDNGFRSEAGHLFLVVGPKLAYTRDDLSRAYHYRTYSFLDTFESPRNLNISWASNSHLVVGCSPCEADPIAIERRRATAGQVQISYVGIPESPFPDSGE